MFQCTPSLWNENENIPCHSASIYLLPSLKQSMTWFVFEYPLVYLSCSTTESRNYCVSSTELLIFFGRKYCIENFSVFLHSDNLQRVLMWSSPLTAAAIILRMQRYKARMQCYKAALVDSFQQQSTIYLVGYNTWRSAFKLSIVIPLPHLSCFDFAWCVFCSQVAPA